MFNLSYACRTPVLNVIEEYDDFQPGGQQIAAIIMVENVAYGSVRQSDEESDYYI